MRFVRVGLLFIFLVLSACSSGGSQSTQPTKTGGYIQNKGSDTLVNLALAWAEKYQADNPGVTISVTGGGSGTGIAALINGTVDLANASRKIEPGETDQLKAKGKDPVEFIVARDAIAVIVNPTNPVNQLTIQQISDIYTGKINNWSQVGGKDLPIVRLSREVNSGTHVYFRDTVIRLGQKDNKALFATNTLLLPSSEGIVSELRQNPDAIGYDGLGYVPKDLKVIAVAQKAGEPYVLPSVKTTNDKTYPIARDLYMYTAGQPSGLVKQYLDWISTPEAQKIVADEGFVPIQK
jgi:phosphate transport system substrate-binding protein